ncbi:MAG: N-6 DNA methylase [Bacteroidales bacterium]|nr:N-6 DNA methylase [Bacteroidales bacterium]MBR4497696.1 N-6 DNA methylase [Bacteroidales bacterium]
MEIQIKDNKIFAPLKEKWLVNKPEEVVRQTYICRLVDAYGYSLEQMAQEMQVTNSQRGQGAARADIVIWRNKEDKDKNKYPLIVVECKAETVTIHKEDYYQGMNYASWVHADFFVTTNLKETRIFKIVKGEIPDKLEEVIDIPDVIKANNQKEIDKLLNQTKAFTREEFSRLLFKCHNIIRNNDKLSPEAAFDEISKILFIKIRFERDNTGNQIFSLKTFKKDKESYERYKPKGGEDFYQFLFTQTKQQFASDHLFDDNAKIEIRENSFEQIVKELEIYNLSTTSDDVKGIAFEKFLGKTFRGELGQFFTPRTIVDFMVSILDPQEGEYVCDPCCGSGGFLIKTFEYVREHIEKDVEAQKETIKQDCYGESYEKLSDKGKLEIETKVSNAFTRLNEELNINNEKGRLRSLSFDCIYGTDANPRMARTAKMNMIMHGDGHGGVHHHDGLLNVNGIFENRFDIILTNPPFGARVDKELKISEADRFTDAEKIKAYIDRYGDAYKDALKQVNDNVGKSLLSLYKIDNGLTEVLFIERCLNLLKPGGRMGIVLPEGVLNNSNLQKVREFVESKAKILLIVSIPQDVFIASGATVKPSLLFFKKFTEKEAEEYEKIKTDATERFDAKYADELSSIEEQLEKRGKDALSKEEKKDLLAQKKQIMEQKQSEIKAEIKEKFDYEVPIADVQKAGISTTGAVIENELIPLAEEFTPYRKEMKLWNVPIKETKYNLSDDGKMYRVRMTNSIVSEPEVFYGLKK